MKSRAGVIAEFTLRATATLALLWFVASRVDLAQAARDFRASAWWGPAAVALLMVLNLALQWTRWHLVVRASGMRLPARRTLKMMLAGLPLGLLTPGRMGEFGRGLAVVGSHDAVSIAGLTALERGFGFVGSIGIALVAMILSGYGTAWKWAAILAFYLLAVLLILRPYRLAALARYLAPRLPGALGRRAGGIAERLVKGWELAGRRAALAVLVVSVLQTAVALLQMTIFYLAAAGPQPILKVFGSWAVVLGAKHFLPVTVGDLGVREGLAVAVFANRRLPTSPALVAALVVYVINVLIPTLVGTVVLARGRRKA